MPLTALCPTDQDMDSIRESHPAPPSPPLSLPLTSARQWVAVPILAASVLWLLVLSTFIVQTGTPGIRTMPVQNGLIVSKVDRPINGFQEGDLIQKISGIPYTRMLGYPLLDLGPKTPQRTVTLQRNGQTLTLPVDTLVPGPIEFFKAAWSHLLIIAALLLPPFLAVFMAPRRQPALLFLFTFAAFALVIINTLALHFGLLEPKWLAVSLWAVMLFNWLAFSAMVHFLMQFPVEHQVLTARPVLTAMLYLLPPLGTIAGAYVFGGATPDFFGWMQRLRRWSVPLCLALTWGKMLFDFFKPPTPFVRQQLKWPLLSLLLGISPYLLLYLAPSVLFNRPLIHFQIVIIAGTLIPMAFFLSMIRHRLLDLDDAVSQTVTYFLLIGILSLLYAALLVVIGDRLHQGDRLSEYFIFFYLLLIAFIFDPLRTRIRSFIDRLFIRDRLDLSRVLHAFSRKIVKAIRMPELADLIVTELPEAFRIERACLLNLTGDKARLYPEDDRMKSFVLSRHEMIDHLAAAPSAVVCRREPPDPAAGSWAEELAEAGYALALGLKSGGVLVGALFLGPKRNQRRFSGKDLEAYSTLSAQVALALENARRYEALQDSKASIQEMYDKLVRSEKLADIGEMTAVLAHEIKNPLGIIRSSAQYLSAEARLGPDQSELLDFIVQEVDNLNLVVENLLGLARYKPPELKRVDLGAFLQARLEHWKRSKEHNPRVRVSLENAMDGQVLYADDNQLSQVVLNLLQNSEDVMPEGGEIQVRACKAPDGGGVVISVQDTGPGIPENMQGEVFKKFFTTKEKGLGLGLFVSRQIVKAHSGTIDLSRGPEGGTVARIRLPLQPHAMVGSP